MAEIADIVTKLWERTNQHKISWEPTVNENTFLATIGDSSSVTVTSYRSRDGDDEVRFRILDERGRELEEYDTDENEDDEVIEKLNDIYNEARRTALQINSRLDELLEELEKE